MYKPDICLFHGPDCSDGAAAAWAVWKRWPDIEFVACNYDKPLPDLTNKHVLMVDFSVKSVKLAAISKVAASVIILDHHESARKDLAPYIHKGLIDAGNASDLLSWMRDHCDGVEQYAVTAVFDMEKSGAMLAWEFCHPATPTPALIKYVEDRDLWKFELPFSAAINAAIASYPCDICTMDDFSKIVSHTDRRGDMERLIWEGVAIIRRAEIDMAASIKQTLRSMWIGGYNVPVININYCHTSEAVGMIAKGHPFAAGYYDMADGRRKFSLRRRDGDFDCSALAAAYGGGGHKPAAGFTAPSGWEGEASPIEEALCARAYIEAC